MNVDVGQSSPPGNPGPPRTAPSVDASNGPAARSLARTGSGGGDAPRTLVAARGNIADPNGAGSAAALFDGDARTAITIAPHAQRTVRIDRRGKQLLGLAVIGAGSAKITVQTEDDAGRQVVDGMSDSEVSLAADRWASLTATKAPVASRLVVSWASADAAAQVGDVALWVAGRARDALSEASLADRLVTALPDNAVEARARPETASVTRVTPKGPQSAQLVVKLDRDPALLGRVFLVYELERLAHWTAPSRLFINGHVLRGGYRANVRGLGGVQVEDTSPAWLHRGDNAVTFTPSQAEDGLGYVVRNARIVGAPRGPEASEVGETRPSRPARGRQR